MSVVVRERTFAEVSVDPAFGTLLDEYIASSSIAGLPRPKTHAESYKQLEDLGMMKGFCAYLDDELIGFANIVVSIIPHYSVKVATMESWFVEESSRSTGVGLKLKKAAEEAAKEMGAVGFFISAPMGSKLAQLMERHSPYNETTRVFFRPFE